MSSPAGDLPQYTWPPPPGGPRIRVPRDRNVRRRIAGNDNSTNAGLPERPQDPSIFHPSQTLHLLDLPTEVLACIAASLHGQELQSARGGHSRTMARTGHVHSTLNTLFRKHIFEDITWKVPVWFVRAHLDNTAESAIEEAERRDLTFLKTIGQDRVLQRHIKRLRFQFHFNFPGQPLYDTDEPYDPNEEPKPTLNIDRFRQACLAQRYWFKKRFSEFLLTIARMPGLRFEIFDLELFGLDQVRLTRERQQQMGQYVAAAHLDLPWGNSENYPTFPFVKTLKVTSEVPLTWRSRDQLGKIFPNIERLYIDNAEYNIWAVEQYLARRLPDEGMSWAEAFPHVKECEYVRADDPLGDWSTDFPETAPPFVLYGLDSETDIAMSKIGALSQTLTNLDLLGVDIDPVTLFLDPAGGPREWPHLKMLQIVARTNNFEDAPLMSNDVPPPGDMHDIFRNYNTNPSRLWWERPAYCWYSGRPWDTALQQMFDFCVMGANNMPVLKIMRIKFRLPEMDYDEESSFQLRIRPKEKKITIDFRPMVIWSHHAIFREWVQAGWKVYQMVRCPGTFIREGGQDDETFCRQIPILKWELHKYPPTNPGLSGAWPAPRWVWRLTESQEGERLHPFRGVLHNLLEFPAT